MDRKNVNVQDESQIDDSLLKSIVQHMEEGNDDFENIVNKKPAKKKKFRFKPSKKKDSTEFVDIESDFDGSDFVIVSDEENNVMERGTKIVLKSILALITVGVLTSIFAFCLLYKSSAIDSEGSKEVIKDKFYVTPSDYRPNTSALKMGDKFVVSNQSKFVPFMFNYKVYSYKSRKGSLLSAIDEKTGKEELVSAESVNYILR